MAVKKINIMVIFQCHFKNQGNFLKYRNATWNIFTFILVHAAASGIKSRTPTCLIASIFNAVSIRCNL